MHMLKYLSVVGLLLFAFILATIDLGETVAIIAGADLRFILLAILLVLVETVIRGLNWKVFASIYAHGYRLADALQTYMIGIAFGSSTPGRAGDLVKVTDLRDKTGMTSLKALAVGVLDRIINFIVLFVSAGVCTALVAFMFTGGEVGVVTLLAPILATVAALAVALNESLSTLILRPLQNFLIPERFRDNTKQLFKAFHEVVSGFKGSGDKWTVMALTLLGWLTIFARPYFFGRAVGVDAELWVYILFIPIISIAEVLPLSVMGVGTRDATILFLFTQMGIEREPLVAMSAMILLLSTTPQVIAGYLIAWNRKVRVHDEGTVGESPVDKR
ncbi:MAG: flippase-like domain-containing protein [Candidatus Altiarchaeales archaeon]|nr:flippase-like domain-containing protein [Candidatus Altiarchaeales archaeon]MBD3417075.1 flippase-like domain-containing protein [Candidatus Altiarchaeales archaeon]